MVFYIRRHEYDEVDERRYGTFWANVSSQYSVINVLQAIAHQRASAAYQV